GGLSRQLTMNVDVPTELDLGGFSLTGTYSGVIVAYAIVPEPSTFALAGFGLVALAYTGLCRRRTG
ncbi:MAG: PEP-CTERM sorting domain-containing protein, partial [Pirellulales bacterium]